MKYLKSYKRSINFSNYTASSYVFLDSNGVGFLDTLSNNYRVLVAIDDYNSNSNKSTIKYYMTPGSKVTLYGTDENDESSGTTSIYWWEDLPNNTLTVYGYSNNTGKNETVTVNIGYYALTSNNPSYYPSSLDNNAVVVIRDNNPIFINSDSLIGGYFRDSTYDPDGCDLYLYTSNVVSSDSNSYINFCFSNGFGLLVVPSDLKDSYIAHRAWSTTPFKIITFDQLKANIVTSISGSGENTVINCTKLNPNWTLTQLVGYVWLTDGVSYPLYAIVVEGSSMSVGSTLYESSSEIILSGLHAGGNILEVSKNTTGKNIVRVILYE